MKKEGRVKNRKKNPAIRSAPFCLYLPIVAFYYRLRLEKGSHPAVR